MKRNLLLLAVMAITVFGFSSLGLAQCPQDTVDTGICDTLDMFVYPGDEGFTATPAYVRFPVYITHDLIGAPDNFDKLGGFAIPLCFTSSNAAAKCVIDSLRNSFTDWPSAAADPTCLFRDLPGESNIMANTYQWEIVTIEIDSLDHIWFSSVPFLKPLMGTESHSLLATVTFTIWDSTTICIDSCFWPPTSRLAFSRADAKTYVPRHYFSFCQPCTLIPNLPPVVTCPGNQSHNQNGTYTATGVIANDPDCPAMSNLSSWSVSYAGGAGVNGASVVFVNVNQANPCNWTADVQYNVVDHCLPGGTVTVTATDNLNGTGFCTFNIGTTNGPPVIACPATHTSYTGQVDSFLVTATDPDNDPLTFKGDLLVNPAFVTVRANGWVVVSAAVGDEGNYGIDIIVEDCGAADTCTVDLTVELLLNPVVFIEDFAGKPDCFQPGNLVYVPIQIRRGFRTDVGGFELHVDFDYTTMCFVGAIPGPMIDGEAQLGDFEEFTYRLLPCPLPPCWKYKILLFGMYDLPGGTVGTPIPAFATGDLLYLRFIVNNDQTLRGMTLPICWQWIYCDYDPPYGDPFDPECGENTFSDGSGNILYTSAYLCQFDPVCCDFPGVPPEQTILFQHEIPGPPDTPCEDLPNCGGIPICPDGPGLCKRGDVNANGVPYEVADAVLFARYFVEGIDVFEHNEDYQVCATDVNADGRPLSLSDFVYLVRVILHDAVEIPKLAPSSEVANLIVYNNTITVECASAIGAILFEFDGAVVPTMLADMDMRHSDNKVLVWTNGNPITTAEVLNFAGEAELVSASAVDYDTRELPTNIVTKVAPTSFALHAAYPNPFNPFTNLSFTLPEAANYSLRIYNVAGQLVRSYEGLGSVGLNVVTWDAKDNAGVEVASGVYFYKLNAASFSATQKMVMMK